MAVSTSRVRLAVGSVAFAILAAPFVSFPAVAQEGDPEFGETTWKSAPCQECHGWAGDGVPETPQYEGANLRQSFLGPEDVAEVIKCGIPGTYMPSFRNNAWTEHVPCYGMSEPMEAPLQPSQGERMFGDRAINGLVAFLFRDIIQKGPVTREYCTEMLGPESPRCTAYPPAAEVAAAGNAAAAPADAAAAAEPAPAQEPAAPAATPMAAASPAQMGAPGAAIPEWQREH